ncbi:MAG: sigma-70 family RNA polymerase sigma factor [Deltaproteobacteria bacterium]|nr:sigma-70 family RNA polymerase sigma factor [Deltaproteobacteria bacterium]
MAQVIRVFTPLVRSIVCRYWKSEFEREEAAHLVWLKAYEKRMDVDPDQSETFAGWLATLARHRCIDRLRRQGRQIGPDRDDPQVSLERATEPARAEELVQRKQLQAALEGFASGLEADWRRFFQLHFQQGLDYSQVAAELGISVRRCKYLKKVLVQKARRHTPLLQALGRGSG